jgi:hypothetical protein
MAMFKNPIIAMPYLLRTLRTHHDTTPTYPIITRGRSLIRDRVRGVVSVLRARFRVMSRVRFRGRLRVRLGLKTNPFLSTTLSNLMHPIKTNLVEAKNDLSLA